MNELQVFRNNEFGEVRTLLVEGKPYFVARDVAISLGYKNISDAISRHCRRVVKHDIPHPQSKTKTIGMNCIPEGDIYRLVVNSELPSAERFEAWIFDEVLPSIRKNGGYIANQENLTPEQIVAQALIVANNIIQEKDRLLAEQKPKVLFADAVSTSHTSILVGELAKLINQNGVDIGQNRLFEWLRDNGFLIKRNGTDYNMPTQYSMDLGLFEIKERSITNPDGSVRITKTPKVTGKGQQYFINKFFEIGGRMDKEYLEKKRLEVLDTIKPICEAFNIDDYDYEINAEGQTEVLRVCDVRIGCSCNSIDAVKNELIGFIFLRTWCRYRSLGAFDTQCKNVIKRYWIK